MRLPIVLLLFAATTATAASGGTIVDTFENNANPNGWYWGGSDPAAGAGITASGGDPGSWADSGAPFVSFEPEFRSNPPPGSELRAALASAALRTASIEFQRLDTTGVANCSGGNDAFKTLAFSIWDEHTASLPIRGVSTIGPATPYETYPWTRAHFVIPSDSPTTPRGWNLVQAPDGYTWADLMHNADSIHFYALFTPFAQPGACYHYGADNVVITYGDKDAIFADAFDDGDGRPNPVQDSSFEATTASGGTNPSWSSTDTNPRANGASVLFNAADTAIVPRSGHYAAWFGGWNSGSETQTLSQTVTLPASGPLYLNYFRQTVFQVDTSANFVVSIDGTALETTDLGMEHDLAYVAHSLDISAYADGGSHEIEFRYDYNAQDSVSDGATLVDDVTIDPTPAATTASDTTH